MIVGGPFIRRPGPSVVAPEKPLGGVNVNLCANFNCQSHTYCDESSAKQQVIHHTSIVCSYARDSAPSRLTTLRVWSPAAPPLRGRARLVSGLETAAPQAENVNVTVTGALAATSSGIVTQLIATYTAQSSTPFG